jgi:two-component system, NarL family, sensor histidine kinase EvgS
MPGLAKRIIFASLCCLALEQSGAQTASPAPAPGPPGGAAPAGSRLDATPAERAWLETNPAVNVGIDPNWPPFSFVDKSGAHQGIDADLVRLIAARIALKYQIVPTRSWEQTMQQMAAHEVELVPGVAYHAGRTPGFRYTNAYLSFPVAIVTRSDGPFHVSLRELAEKTLALPRGYVTSLNVQRDFPSLRVVMTNDAAEALALVARGDAFATVENLATATYLIKTRGLTNLKIAGMTDYQFELRFAVAEDKPELFSLVESVLQGMTEQQFSRICDRWIPVEYAMDDSWSRLGRRAMWAGLGVVAMLGMFFLWNRRLAKELAARRRVQDELADANLRLEAANTRLRQLNEESELFMNIAAHDLRSPLNIILLSCEMIETQAVAAAGAGTVAPATRPAQRLIDGIKESVLRMNALVQNFLSAQVIAHGDRELNHDPVDLTDIVKRAVERHQALADLKRIKMVAEFDDAPRQISGDAGALDQVLDNLVSNALKFTPPDGRITLRMGPREGQVRLEVHDDGPGISEEDLPKLFTRFTKLKSRPTARESSTGLGLSIVKHFVTGMGGRVWCETPDAKGARFIVELPLLAPAQSPKA